MWCLYIFVVTVKSIFQSTRWYFFSFQKEWVILKHHIFVLISICESKYARFSEMCGLFRNNWGFPKFDKISKKGADIEISQLLRYFCVVSRQPRSFEITGLFRNIFLFRNMPNIGLTHLNSDSNQSTPRWKIIHYVLNCSAMQSSIFALSVFTMGNSKGYVHSGTDTL
jgi:hypothetical protein